MIVALDRILRLRTLRRRLSFWTGLVICSLGILIGLSIFLADVKFTTARIKRQLEDAVSLQSIFHEQWAIEHSSQIRYLAKVISGPGKSKDQIGELFYSFVVSQEEFGEVIYVEPSGLTAVDTGGMTGIDVTDREYFQAAKEGKEWITDILLSKKDGAPVVVFSAPVKDTLGMFNGVVLGVIQIRTLERMMSHHNFNDTGDIYMLDRQGRFITSPRQMPVEPLTLINNTDIVERASGASTFTGAYRNYLGEKVYGAYGWTKGGQWLIITEVNRNSVLRPLYMDILLISGIMLVMMIVSVIVVTLLSKRIERPIQYLLVGTKIMREGNYDYRISKDLIRSAPVELQQLCDNFNVTAQKLKSTIQMLEQNAVMDELTEVYNRRFIMNEGYKLLETCIRAQQPCTVLMIDVDFFKKVNDTYGHLVGDRVILYAASILLSCIRACDLVSRYGGEEFLILAPNTSAGTGGWKLGERIRQSFEDRPYREDGIEIPLTVSIGAADYSHHSHYGKTALEDMISRADEALYKAKKTGRNRVEIA